MFLAITVKFSVTGLPLAAKMPPPPLNHDAVVDLAGVQDQRAAMVEDAPRWPRYGGAR